MRRATAWRCCTCLLYTSVDTGEFPVAALKDLLRSLHQKKRYHRLRDGRLLRLDDSLEGLDELNDTLELSGAKLKKMCIRDSPYCVGLRLQMGRMRSGITRRWLRGNLLITVLLAVSYTHLDVYKRQSYRHCILCKSKDTVL